MSKITEVLKNSYFDSVTLMTLSNRILKGEGVKNAMVAMATPINKELLERVGLADETIRSASPNDLLIAVEADTDAAGAEAVKAAKEALFSRKKATGAAKAAAPRSTAAAVEANHDLNLAIVSVAGQFAAREVRQALANNLNVMLFSDNVSVADELECKKIAHEKGLLLMGPDCGTAIINNVGLCFANQVRRGPIGLIAAAGTGLQEVTALIDQLGGGVSQAVGLGGRDLSADIGGIMMLDALEALRNDSATTVIVLVSKPPAREVADKVMTAVRACGKPVVVCFIGGGDAAEGNVEYADSLEDAATRAVRLAGAAPGSVPAATLFQLPEAEALAAARKLCAQQKYIRGLFCGGTLAAEAELVMHGAFADVFSNIAKKPEYRLADPLKSVAHTVIDLGDDQFTQGRPHPMIDPTLRIERLVEEAADPETAVLLMDFEIGYGSHEDPAGVTLDGIRAARKAAAARGCEVAIVGYVLGTAGDYQGMDGQIRKLREEGVVVCPSNLQAARAAVEIVKSIGDGACR